MIFSKEKGEEEQKNPVFSLLARAGLTLSTTTTVPTSITAVTVSTVRLDNSSF
jgi:hypothetical protein